MAKVNYEKVYKQLRDEEEARKSAIKKADKKANVQSQIKNITTRMEASGVDVEKETDKRNPVEKFLGLPEDQNILFDFFELLGRPQQALFGAWKENQDGGDLKDSLKSAWEHFKGDEETNFKEILQDNRLGLEFDDRKGKVDLVDVLGFAGDVALDPADWALIAAAPFTGGTSLTGLAANVKDVAKVANVANDASKVIDAGKMTIKAADAAQIASKADNIAKAGGNVVRKSLSDLVFEGVGKGVKGAAKLADTGVSKYLGHLDEVKGVASKIDNLAKHGNEMVKLGYTNKNASTVADLGKYVRNKNELSDFIKYAPKGRLEKYVELKETVSNLFKLGDGAKSAMKIARESDYMEDIVKKRILKTLSDYDGDVAKAKKVLKMSADDINKAMTDMIEYKGLNRVQSGKKIMAAAKSGTLVANKENIAIIDELADAVNKAGRKYGGEPFKLGYKTDNGFIKLDSNWNPKVLEEVGVSIDPELLAKQYKLGTNYTEEQLKYLEKLEKNKEFMKFYEEHKDLSVRLNKIIDDEFGKNFSKKFGKNEGYVPHIGTGAAADSKISEFKITGEPRLLGNTDIMSERKRLGSVLEENSARAEILKKNYDNLSDAQKKFVDDNSDIFERNFSAAMSKKYLDELPTLLKNDRNITEILVNQSFGDIEGMVKLNREIKKASISGDKNTMLKLVDEYNKKFGNSNIKLLGDNGKPPIGYVKIGDNADYVASKIDEMAEQLGGADVKKFTKQIRDNGKDLAIDSSVLNLLQTLDFNKKEANALLRIYDKYLGMYKKWKVFSPTFIMNNLTGNSSNLWLSGINMTDQIKYSPDAFKVMTKGKQLVNERALGKVLSDSDNRIADLYEMLAKEGFGDNMKAFDLQDFPDSLRKYFDGDNSPKNLKEVIFDGLPWINARLNTKMDGMARTIIMLKSIDDPSYLAKLGLQAGDYGGAIRRVMFDPTEMTATESEWMKRLIPFYTFAKKNLAYQIDNLGRNGGRYHKLIKSVQSLQDMATDGNRENMEEYIKNNLYIPYPALSEDGSYRVIRAQLPFGNLIDMVNDPLNGTLSMFGPIKTPIELAMNKNIFTGADIEKYPGEKSNTIPFMTKKGEHLLGGLTGFDVPIKTGSRIFNGIQDTMNNGGTFFEGLGKGALNTVTMKQNINTDELSRMYDELDELEVLMQQYKGMGYEFATINELKKANPNATTNRIMAQLNKMSNIDTEPFEYFSDGSTFR